MTTDPRYEMAYAVHTRTCTYLLDEDGVCRWIVSARGVVPPHVQQCIGAQFVACLDLGVEGGLDPELRPGAMALFVHNTGSHMILLRTGDILHVDDRRRSAASPPSEPPPASLDDGLVEQYGKRGGLPREGDIVPVFGVMRSDGEEQTITVSLPTHRKGP